MKVRINKNNFIYDMIVIYVLIMSGSFLAHSYMDTLEKINFFITIGMMGILLFLRKSIKIHNYIFVYLLVMLISNIVRIWIWNEFDAIKGYLGSFMVVVAFIFLGSLLDYELFVERFLKILMWITVFSIIGYLIYDFMIGLPVPVVGDSWKYHIFGIFVLRENEFNRSVGIFWEPGMYQGYLIFAMLLTVLKTERRRKDWVRFFVFAAGVLTTRSTTGYFLLIILAMLIVLLAIDSKNSTNNSRNRIYQWVILISTMAIALVVLLNEKLLFSILQLFPEDITGKLMDSDNISTNSRLYGMLYDMKIAFQHPLGVGNQHVDQLWDSLMTTHGVKILGRTSGWTTAFVYSGLLGGAMYVYMWIKSCFTFTKGNSVKGFFALIIMALIANTEPHFNTMFFNMIVIMWFTGQNTPRVKSLPKQTQM